MVWTWGSWLLEDGSTLVEGGEGTAVLVYSRARP